MGYLTELSSMDIFAHFTNLEKIMNLSPREKLEKIKFPQKTNQ